MTRWAEAYPSHTERLLAYLKEAKCPNDSPWAGNCLECPLRTTEEDEHRRVISECGMDTITEWLKKSTEAEAL